MLTDLEYQYHRNHRLSAVLPAVNGLSKKEFFSQNATIETPYARHKDWDNLSSQASPNITPWT